MQIRTFFGVAIHDKLLPKMVGTDGRAGENFVESL